MKVEFEKIFQPTNITFENENELILFKRILIIAKNQLKFDTPDDAYSTQLRAFNNQLLEILDEVFNR